MRITTQSSCSSIWREMYNISSSFWREMYNLSSAYKEWENTVFRSFQIRDKNPTCPFSYPCQISMLSYHHSSKIMDFSLHVNAFHDNVSYKRQHTTAFRETWASKSVSYRMAYFVYLCLALKLMRLLKWLIHTVRKSKVRCLTYFTEKDNITYSSGTNMFRPIIPG